MSFEEEQRYPKDQAYQPSKSGGILIRKNQVSKKKKMAKKMKFEVTRYPNRKHTMMYEMKKERKGKSSSSLEDWKEHAGIESSRNFGDEDMYK